MRSGEHDRFLLRWSDAVKDDAIIILNYQCHISRPCWFTFNSICFVNNIVSTSLLHACFIVGGVQGECHWLWVRINRQKIKNKVTFYTIISFFACSMNSCEERDKLTCFVQGHSDLFHFTPCINIADFCESIVINECNKVSILKAELSVDARLHNRLNSDAACSNIWSNNWILHLDLLIFELGIVCFHGFEKFWVNNSITGSEKSTNSHRGTT